MSLVLGIDVATTATKAILVNEGGDVVAKASSPYRFDSPKPLWTEQDPHDWWYASTTAIGQLLRSNDAEHRIDAVGVTGQMHGSVLLNAARQPIRPAILWNDQRTAVECDEIRHLIGRDSLIQTTGNDALTGFTAPKLLWVRRHEPQNWSQVCHVLLPKDYVIFRLTDELAVDVTDGSGTILFDLRARTWSEDLLSVLDLDPSLFPETYESHVVVGEVSRAAADATGLPAGIPVVAGAGDQAANAIGLGAVSPDVTALSLGTSGVVFSTTTEPLLDSQGRLHAFCHAIPDTWHTMGVMLSAGGSLQWLRDALAPDQSFEELTEATRDIPPGSEGLLFLPYLAGERTPHADPLARGAFVGLTLRHDLRHLTLSVLEGVAFGLRDGLDLMVSAGLPWPDEIRASGGGAASRRWLQILADVLESRVVTTQTNEGAAYGAAVLAALGAGWGTTAAATCDGWVTVIRSVEPTPAADVYREIHERHGSLYPALAPAFHRLGNL